jgi:small subunit ribosomal protein S4
VNIPSYSLNVGDTVSVREKSKSLEVITSSLMNSSEKCEYVEWNSDLMSGKLVALPQREQISENIKEQLIVELYSK